MKAKTSARLGRILMLPLGRSADFPVRNNVRRITGPRMQGNLHRVRNSLRTGKSALRQRCHGAAAQPHPGRIGLTLIELLFAVGIGSILVAGIAALSLYGARSFSVIGNYADMDADSRQALDLLSRELRQSSAVLEFQTNLPVKWISVTTNSAVGVTAKVAWDSQARTLTLTSHARDRVLLEECVFWDVKLYQRVPVISVTNVFFTGTGSTNDCKAIEMSWRCSRTNHGQHFNTENLQRAYIVFRNKVK